MTIQLLIITSKRMETSKVILIAVILLMVLLCIVVSDINTKVKVGCVIVFGAFIVQAVGVVVHPKVTMVTYDNILKYVMLMKIMRFYLYQKNLIFTLMMFVG